MLSLHITGGRSNKRCTERNGLGHSSIYGRCRFDLLYYSAYCKEVTQSRCTFAKVSLAVYQYDDVITGGFGWSLVWQVVTCCSTVIRKRTIWSACALVAWPAECSVQMASCRFVTSLEMIDDAKILWYGHSPCWPDFPFLSKSLTHKTSLLEPQHGNRNLEFHFQIRSVSR